MKKRILLIIPALICGMVLISCDSDEINGNGKPTMYKEYEIADFVKYENDKLKFNLSATFLKSIYIQKRSERIELTTA